VTSRIEARQVSQPARRRRKETLVEREQKYVGIDPHRRRSVIVRMTESE
jgi:hypothetical protein